MSMSNDKKLVFTASSLAQKAMDYTVSLQEEAEQVAAVAASSGLQKW
tara:strand:- start:223 stop:363 length:141 start_codon:yes stop_codon:yes gene_type:complete